MISKPARSIVRAIDAAAARWRMPGSRERELSMEWVHRRTGYSFPTVRFAFDRLFGALDAAALEAVIADELGSLDALDGFAERRGRPRAHASAAGRVCIISSRTTIGVAIVPAIFALCAKCRVLIKDREDRLAGSFFATVAEELGANDAVEVRAWSGESDAVDLGGFDVVAAFGSDATLSAIAATLPFSTRFIPYGSKASAGYVTRDALEDWTGARRVARDAATDLLLFEAEGCLSLHVLFVERGAAIAPERFAPLVVEAVRERAQELELAPLDEARAARLASARDLALFRAGDRGSVHSDAAAGYLLVVDPEWDEPPLFLPRTLAIFAVDQPLQASSYLQRHGVSLEGFAVTSSRADLHEAARRTSASRVTTLGSLQSPQLGDFHGGRPRISEFVRWVADET